MPNVRDLRDDPLKVLKKGKPTLTPWLCEVLLTEADTDARRNAAEALRDLGDRRSVDPLLRAAQADAAGWVRDAAIRALERFVDDAKVEAMFRQMAAQAGDEGARDLALQVLRSCRPEGDAAGRAAEFGALLQRCRTVSFAEAEELDYWLEKALSTVVHELSDADLRAVIDLPVLSAKAYGVGPWAGDGVVTHHFGRAKTAAGLELLHRWTMLPYWRRSWIARSLFALVHAAPRRPRFSHNALVEI